mgnify:FL=1|jgi:hypothetical protein
MKIITVNGTDYKLIFSFEAAEYKELIQKMFKVVSGAYVIEEAKDMNNPTSMEIINGTANMIGDTAEICKIAFYAGLLEENPLTKEEAVKVMREYMKTNKLSYKTLNDELRGMMEEDGFFELSGLNDMITQMYGKQTVKIKKVPQDHKKRSTGTK